ncbi:MAG: F0F1 ATP synthase subunit gamma [Hyphomicrobiales bacterium]|nr:F0F1 ATP synthase subunit gamma [Hyphomicrobiales bacterium]
MPSLKDLKNRISSVKATQKITKAMQMVAAAKLRRAQMAAEEARPYSQRMAKVLSNISNAMEGREGVSPLIAGNGSDQVHLLVVATAERGLCGGFNSSIAKMAREKARQLQSEGKEVKLFMVGKKGVDALRMEFSNAMVEKIDFREVKHIEFTNAETVGARILEMFENGEFDVCTLFYSEFKNIMTQIPTAQQLIPALSPDKSDNNTADIFYEYEPDEEEILGELLPRNISVQVFRALLENGASEQGARMAAMDNATRNAGEMIDSLTLSYNRQRQAQITKELIEIISGAEAL